MRTPALLLRLLLILALAVNGVSGAMAGVMPAQPATPTGAAHQMPAGDAGDCGQGHRAGVTIQATQPIDCCHSTNAAGCNEDPQCLQACLHAPVAVPSLPSFGWARLAVDAIVPPLAGDRPTPLLPSPIRPPIA